MNLLISILFLISLWMSFSGFIIKYFEKIYKINSLIKKHIYLLISLGFISSFIFLGSLNILLHLFGITFSNNYLLVPIFITLFVFNFSILKKLLLAFSSDINKIYKNFFYKIDPFINIILLIIIIQIFCLFIRFLLPVTHTDAISQYFYDSLQISRLENLSISDYYQIGESFRTDSLASFFDALILQLTDNWFLVRTIRLLALILIVISSIEMASNIGYISFKRSILLASVILTLPDVWDISLSGKHDVYALLFELIGIYSISLSIITKDNFLKIIYLSSAIFIGFMSVGIRLSSISFLIVSIAFLLYSLFFKERDSYLKGIYKFVSSIRINIILFLIITIIANLIICFFNLNYFSNPFYVLSPPEFLDSFFPNAIYNLDYKVIKEALSLRNIPIAIKPLITILYSIFGIEPIRYGLNKFKDFNSLIFNISSFLNFIGPKAMMVSILSFSPFTVLPFFESNIFNDTKRKSIIFFITIWILLWSISIPYTRVAMASSISLIILGFSKSFNLKFNFQQHKFIDIIKATLITLGLLYTLLFSLWSISYLTDLPLKSLFNYEGYSRTNLTREYLNLQNQILNKKLNENIVPSKSFETKWQEIEKDSNNLLFLKGAPSKYGYFMKRGLITSKEITKIKKIKNNSKCFELDSNQTINESSC